MCLSVVQHSGMSIARIPLCKYWPVGMASMTIVPPKGEEHEDSSGAEAEILVRGGRGVRRYFVQDLVC